MASSVTQDRKTKNTAPDSGPRRKRWGDQVASGEEQREQREAILFETAARLFTRYGFHGTSMSQLTEALGLTKGALYNYVEDKSDLLYKLHLKSAAANRASHDRGVAEGRNGYERVHGIVRHYLADMLSSPTETFIVPEEGALRPEQAQEIRALRKGLERDLRRQIELGIADGSIIPCDVKLVSFALVGAMAWAVKWFDPDQPWTRDQVATGMADLLTRMVAAGPAAHLPTDISQT